MTATLPRPGYAVSVTQAPPLPFSGVRTGRWFVTGQALRGPTAAQTILSLSQFESVYGARMTSSFLYDALDEYFSDGGVEAIVARVLGPAAAYAEAILKDASAGESLKVKGKGPGEWANTYKIVVAVASGAFTLEVQDGSAKRLEISPSFTTQAAAVSWSALSPYITVTLGSSALIPKAETVELINGKDDKASITDASWVAAQNNFLKDMGPGQISQCGRTTLQAYKDQLAHAVGFNRFALLDAPNSSTVVTVNKLTEELRAFYTEQQTTYGMYFARWPVIPGILPNLPREIPPSATVAALIARSEAQGSSPNRPAAANNGKSKRAVGLATEPYENAAKEGPDITRDEMYTKGVNLFTLDQGIVELLGWRSLADPNGTLQDWINAGNCRLRMAIVAKAAIVAKNFILDEVDGAGAVLKEFENALKGMLLEYFNKGLYGKIPEEAFIVNTGAAVNTPTTLANLEIRAEVGLRMAPDAEMVQIMIAKVPITQQLAS